MKAVILATMFWGGDALGCELTMVGDSVEIAKPAGGGCIIHALPTQFPMTPTRLVLTTPDGRYMEFVWDPADPVGMSRSSLVKSSEVGGSWLPALASVPIQFGNVTQIPVANGPATSTPVSLSWTYKYREPTTPTEQPTPVILTISAADPSANFAVGDLQIRLSAQPIGGDTRKTLANPSAPSSAHAGSTRSLALLPSLLSPEVATMIADVVVQRGRQGLLDNAVSQLRAQVCNPARPVSFSVGAAPSTQIDLPLENTCAALNVAKGTTLAGIAESLVDAVLADVVAFVREQVLANADPAAAALLDFAWDVALGQADPMSTQRAFTALTQGGSKPEADQKTGFDLALAVLSACRAADGCDAAMIHDMVEFPSEYFPGFKADPATGALVERLATDGVALIRPPTALRPEELLATAARAYATAQQLRGGDEKKAQAMQAIATAVGRRDLASVVGKLGVLVGQAADGKVDPNLIHLVDLVVAFGEFGARMQAIAEADGDPETSRKSRAEAFSDLVQKTTDRSSREGQWVFGASALIGVGGDTRMVGAAVVEPLSLPLGLSVDRVPNQGKAGLMFAIYPVDLGAYLAVQNDDVAVVGEGAEAALLPQMQFGVTGLSRSTPVVLAAFGGWDPTAATAFVGARVGVEVPLFDLAGFMANRPSK